MDEEHEDDGEVPSVPLEELLEDLSSMQIAEADSNTVETA